MSELSQRASDRRDAEHIRDDGYRTDEERRLAGRYIALDDVLIAAEAKIERRNATYTKPGEGFVCFHCGERFLTYESAKEHFGEKPDAQPTCFATPSPTIAAPSPSNEVTAEMVEAGTYAACMRWAAPFLRILVDGSTVLSDRDDAERLWPETRTALLEIATEIERQGKALRAVEKELDSMDEMAKMSVPPEYHNVARWLRAALAQTEPQA